jgi:hypothetical protein
MNATTGAYEGFRQTFNASEEFWSKADQSNQSGFPPDSDHYQYQVYANGFPEGRIGYMAVQRPLSDFFSTMWSNPAWKFRPPANLDESARFVHLYMSIINGLFEASDYSAPFIGGQIQLCSIPMPTI